jgi:cation transport regulator ChaB
MDTSLTFASNRLFDTFRTVERAGKQWLVVNGVPLVEGVLNGRFVPADEFGSFVNDWNDIPVVLPHPKRNGGSARVPDPDVPVVGRFYNAKMDGNRLVGEYWLDKALLESLRDNDGNQDAGLVLERIDNKQEVETSTGYWSESVPRSGNFKGRKYSYVDQKIHPDHIALLTQEAGACSLADGCGMNRNNQMVWNGGEGSGNFGHSGRPGKVGGSSSKKIGSVDSSKRFLSDLEKTINSYEDHGVDVSLGTKTDTHYRYIVKTTSPTILRRLEGKLKRRIAKGGLAELEHIGPQSFQLLVPIEKIESSYKENVMKIIFSDEMYQNAVDGTYEKRMSDIQMAFDETMRLRDKRASELGSETDVPVSNYWIEGTKDTYVIARKGAELFKVGYTYNESNGKVFFDDESEWVPVIKEERYIEKMAQNVTGSLPAEGKTLWESVYEENKDKGEERAAQIAWGAVRKAGWEKDKDGKWHKKSTKQNQQDLEGLAVALLLLESAS